jgi:hypothetical protein
VEAGTGCCTKVNCCAQATGSSLPRRSVRPGSCYLLFCCCASEFDWSLVIAVLVTISNLDLVLLQAVQACIRQPPGRALTAIKGRKLRHIVKQVLEVSSLVHEHYAAFEWGLPGRLTDNHVSLTHRSLHYNGQHYRLEVVSDRLVTYYLGLSPCQSDLTVIWHAISVNTRVGVVQSSPVHLIPTSSASLRTIRPPSSTIAMQGMRCLPKSSRCCQCYQV